MEFIGQLDKPSLEHVQHCNQRLNDPLRLQVLHNTGLMDTANELAFDRLTQLAARILNVPLTIVSLVSNKKQFFKAAYGLPSPFNETRVLPIDFSICRYTMAGDSIISSNAILDPFLSCHPSTAPWGIGALIVLPLVTNEGYVLGTFCAIDPNPREWTELELEVMRELTASVMAEINLRDQIAKFKKDENLRDTFISALTHDLRTPLTVSKISAQQIGRRFSTDPDVQRSITRITNNLDRADQMIQDLLDANQVKGGTTLTLTLTSCNLFEIAHQCIQGLSTVHTDRFILEAPEKLIMTADADGIRRIIENLASNAAKYGEPDGQINISLKKINNEVQLCVHNFGSPIPEGEITNIFDPFHRTVSATQSMQKGWGLGLPLVRGIAEAHKGHVSVTSSLEEGTCFTVVLPIQALQ
jgi:signal transduction histidine kinase